MTFTIYQIIFLLFAYSFIGWVAETVTADLVYHKFVNRGFLNGPVCMTYGIAAVIMSVSMQEVANREVFLFVGCAVIASVSQWIAGKLLEKLKHKRWWDYSKKRFNIDGYVCLQYTVLWGVLGVITVKWTNALLLKAFSLIPPLASRITIWVLVGIAAIDIIASLAAAACIKLQNKAIDSINNRIAKYTYRLGNLIAEHVEKRVVGAYPALMSDETEPFASGCGFYKLFMLFVIGAFLGDIVETLFCRATAGVWMSRSSLVWGPFSLVWGIAIAIATALLHKSRNKSDAYIFIFGTVLGGVYEYVCSIFTEIVFGQVFWDYSNIPFNIGGRINLLYCFFWGIAAVVWIKGLYPVFSRLIESIPNKIGKAVTWLLVVFMICNITVSVMALIRYDERANGVEASAGWQQTMDERFGDERMKRIYPNAVSR
ncbi:MAG: hypothetical protein ACI4EJ_10010 [Bacteroides sp.]